MAIRLPFKKIEEEKAEYIKYLLSYLHEPAIADKFQYRSFYENDAEVQKVRLEIAVRRQEQERKLAVQALKVTQALEDKRAHKTNSITEKESKDVARQQLENLLKRINNLKQKLQSSRVVTPLQRSEIERLHHEIIFLSGLSDNQQLVINRKILHLQDIVNDIDSSERRRPINMLIEELKLLTMEEGFIERRKSIRKKIKNDKQLLKEDIKALLHRLNQTEPYVPKVEPRRNSQAGYTDDISTIVEQPQELIIPWSQIVFGNNVMRITDGNGRFLLAPKVSCRMSYNQVKVYLADKLPQIAVIKNSKGAWTLKEPVVFDKAIQMIRRQESEDLIQDERYKQALRSLSSMEEYLKNQQNREHILEQLKAKKQKFLNYLIQCQLDDYKLIPAIEMVAHESSEGINEEDVFIFTIPCKYHTGTDCVNIVYENVNEARASIVCIVEKENYTQALQSLYNFMNDADEKNKRSRLHQTLSLNHFIKKLRVVNHIDMHTWAMAVQR